MNFRTCTNSELASFLRTLNGRDDEEARAEAIKRFSTQQNKLDEIYDTLAHIQGRIEGEAEFADDVGIDDGHDLRRIAGDLIEVMEQLRVC